MKLNAKFALRAAALAIALPLAGCGMDDVQFNGKIFDALGVNSTGSIGDEPKLKQRAPLVVPPTLEKLPYPGSEDAKENAGIADINDPDKSKVASREELERQQAAYCKVHYEEARDRGHEEADAIEGPLGPCRASIIDAVKKWNSGGEEVEPQ